MILAGISTVFKSPRRLVRGCLSIDIRGSIYLNISALDSAPNHTINPATSREMISSAWGQASKASLLNARVEDRSVIPLSNGVCLFCFAFWGR
jgi:hypothetical protein